MIEVVIPQDVLKHKAKFLGNLSTREVVCGGSGIALALFMRFVVLTRVENQDTRLFLIALTVLPFVLVGFVPIYGQPFEKIALTMVLENYIYPMKRRKEVRFPEYEKFEKTRPWLFIEESEPEAPQNKKSKGTKGRAKPQKVRIKPSEEYAEVR